MESCFARGVPKDVADAWALDTMSTKPMRIKLDETHFRALVAGEVATVTTHTGREVTILLADIGFDVMLLAIEAAMEGGSRA